MSFYHYYQKTPESAWIPALDETRDAIIKAWQPPFTTILSLDPLVTEDMAAEDLAKIKYKGPFYADFDSPAEDRETVISRFNYFLDKLVNLGVELDQVELYASGGKGFHLLIPQKVFLQKPPAAGMVLLPVVYKEIAHSLYVNTLDMVVYSARKGRMFRTVNVQRPNGKYKVPLTVAEVRAMTPELYEELTSKPRPVPLWAEPTFCPLLATEFGLASGKMTAAIKARAKFSKLNDKMLAKFNGGFPPSMQAIMSGETREGTGFQALAMQLGCAANALGKTEDELVEACAGLLANHVSDGIRYNTPSKRAEELRRMARYTKDHPGYSFSVGGLKSCAAAGARCRDLDDELDIEPNEDGSEGAEIEGEDSAVTVGIRVNRMGVFLKKEGILYQVCALGMTNPKQLIELTGGHSLGYEVDGYLDGQAHGKVMIDMGSLQNRARFNGLISSYTGGGIQMTDSHVSGLAEMLRLQAKGKGQVYTVGQEGIDIITVKNPAGEYTQERIYASKDGVMSLGEWHTYRLRSLYSGDNGQMDCDIHTAPALENSELSRDFFSRFFKLNAPGVVARCFGWYLAAFISPMIRNKFNQYPLLQIVGPAGAGKSQYTDLLMALHYHRQKPKIFSASNITPFALDSTLNASSSIPIVFDELKASEIHKSMHDKLRTAFRANYNGRVAAKGRVDHAKTKDALSSTGLGNRAPLSFIGEALESQTAIVDRCVIVSLNEKGREGTRDDFEWCMVHKEVLSQLGRVCIDQAMRINLDKMAETVLATRKLVQEGMPKGRNNVDRPAFNYAVVMVGIDFGKAVLQSIFKDDFDAVFGTVFDDMKQGIIDNLADIIPRNMSEASKVLSALAHLSKYGKEMDTKLKHGEDYVYWQDAKGNDCVDIRLRSCYDKYRRHVRSLGEEPLYSNFDGMWNGLREHPALTSRACFDNVEFKGGPTGPMVYRFDLDKLYKGEGIEEFDMLPPKAVVLAFPKQV